MSAPDRIWAGLRGSEMSTSASFRDVEYIRDDLVPQWQPIETVPRDFGVVVLAKSKEFGPYLYEPNRLSFMDPPPTHWMPIPNPPKEPKP